MMVSKDASTVMGVKGLVTGVVGGVSPVVENNIQKN
jgi:hypothetical protein